ncbi:hypothetical protein ACFSZS_06950 [Seohaeicola zhoushanensis]
MRHWLSHFITALAVLCLAGAALVGALALGFYYWGRCCWPVPSARRWGCRSAGR